MASKYCLPKNLALEFRKRLTADTIEQLSNMTSKERHSYFAEFLGDANALNVNSLFESKLLLKNQQKGMVNWAKTVTGLKPQIRANLIDRISKMKTILSPTEEKAFLKDLAATKIGTEVTPQEAQKLTELSSKVQQAREELQSDIDNIQKQTRLGEAIYDTQQYLDELNPNKGHIVANVIGIPRNLVASLDFVSAPFRHGYFSMSNPAWIRNYVQIPKLLVSESAFRTRMGKIYGSKYYDSAIKAGLKIFKTGGDLSKQEEGFASNVLNKFPITRGSKRAYTGFLNGLRMDMMVSIMKAEELRGGDVGIGSKFVKDMATTINNITGAGSLGRFENAVPEINLAIFSARMQMARINMLNPITYLNPKTDPAARIFALKNLIGSLAISGTLLGLASLAGLKVNMTNPNKTDFGEIHVGNLTIDMTGGNRTWITFLSRMITGQYISSKGKLTQLDVGAYKPLTRKDIAVSFAMGKVAPGAASILADFLSSTQKTPNSPRIDGFGNTINIQNELKKQLMPLNITNGMDMFEADPSNTILGIVLGLFGVPVNVGTTKK